MADAFMGYLLPWGQMSYWGAQVIISLFGAIPVIGNDLTQWIRGDYLISGITLNRFFALHVVALPIVILGLVVLHILALHEVGSNNPDGVDIKKHKDENGIPLDGIAFHPYYTVKDIVGVVVFLFIFCFIVFFFPEMGGYFLEKPNFEQANPFKTPEHIAPVWYFTPFYSILRATTADFMGWLIAGVAGYVLLLVFKSRLTAKLKIVAIVIGLAIIAGMLVFDAKFWGVVLMGLSVVILGGLPWLDHSQVKSIRYRPSWHKYVYLVFAIAFVILGYLGVQPPTAIGTTVSQVCSFIYLGFFLLMPWWSAAGTFKPVPERVVYHPH